MTYRITIGIDVGLSGCVAVLHDGEPVRFDDMPTMSKTSGKGNQVNAVELAAILRGIGAAEPGASLLAVVELVSSMPGQGGTSIFSFGKSAGIVEGVLATLGYKTLLVTPQKWKKAADLIGREKDFARTKAIQRFPAVAADLKLKKHGGRADAIWIARYGFDNWHN